MSEDASNTRDDDRWLSFEYSVMRLSRTPKMGSLRFWEDQLSGRQNPRILVEWGGVPGRIPPSGKWKLMVRVWRRRSIVLWMFWGVWHPALGAVLVTADLASSQLQPNGAKNSGMVMRLGANTSLFPATQGSRVVVYVFQLPAPKSGEQAVVVDADFHFTITTDRADGAYNIDLYGLGLRSSPTVLSTDNFAGALDTTDATLLQDNIINAVHPDKGAEAVSSSLAAKVALIDYLNAQYGADGSGAGNYVFLRLNPDTAPGNENTGVDVAFPSNSTGQPELSLTLAVPEPSGLMTVLILFAAFTLRRTGVMS